MWVRQDDQKDSEAVLPLWVFSAYVALLGRSTSRHCFGRTPTYFLLCMLHANWQRKVKKIHEHTVIYSQRGPLTHFKTNKTQTCKHWFDVLLSKCPYFFSRWNNYLDGNGLFKFCVRNRRRINYLSRKDSLPFS